MIFAVTLVFAFWADNRIRTLIPQLSHSTAMATSPRHTLNFQLVFHPNFLATIKKLEVLTTSDRLKFLRPRKFDQIFARMDESWWEISVQIELWWITECQKMAKYYQLGPNASPKNGLEANSQKSTTRLGWPFQNLVTRDIEGSWAKRKLGKCII